MVAPKVSGELSSRPLREREDLPDGVLVLFANAKALPTASWSFSRTRKHCRRRLGPFRDRESTADGVLVLFANAKALPTASSLFLIAR